MKSFNKEKADLPISSVWLMNAIESQHSEFSISDIERACPNVSRVMIKKVLLRQQKDKKIKCLGKGQSAKWERMVY